MLLLFYWMNDTFSTHPLIPLYHSSTSPSECILLQLCPVSQADWTQSEAGGLLPSLPAAVPTPSLETILLQINLGLTFHSITQSNWLNLIAKLQRNWDMWNDPFPKHLQICNSFFFCPTDLLCSSYTNNCISTCKDVLSCGTKICRHKAAA